MDPSQQGVPIGCRSPRQRGPYSTPINKLGFFNSSNDTIIRASTDNDTPGEFQIKLTGVKALTVDDFFM